MTTVDDATIAWLNANPDEAIRLLPEVKRYVSWRDSPYTFHSDAYTLYSDAERGCRTGPLPEVFTTTEGREIR